MSASGGAFMYWYLRARTIHVVHPYRPTSSALRAATVTLLSMHSSAIIATNSSSNLCRNEHCDSSCHCTTQADGKRPPHQCRKNPWRNFALQNRYRYPLKGNPLYTIECLVFSPKATWNRNFHTILQGWNLKLIKRHHRTRCPNHHCGKLPLALHDRCCHSPTALAPPASRMEDMWHVAKHLSSKMNILTNGWKILLIDSIRHTTWDG